MAQFFSIHPENPQSRLVRQAVAIIQQGGVVVYPTDSSYALGCRLDDKDAMMRIRAIREVGENHHFTLVCRDLAEIARYAKVDNQQYRLLKANTPGSYTFILQATREVPRRLQHPKRATIGRVDLILDGGPCGVDMTTVIDLTQEAPVLIRAGKGNLEPFGLNL
jgi:tRNA threonylcarbamoyl adenosine modification protein (Sua5/YciO/YrdC/YwlC family)